MRYIIQIVAMLIELVIVVAAGVIIYERPAEPITWGLVCLGFMAWQEQGGFMAWNPKTIKQFLANAKEIGL